MDLKFKDKVFPIHLFIIPSISQRLILGIDFWKKFDLLPSVVESVDLIDKSIFSVCPSVLKEKSNCPSEKI